jgi:arginase family enzyme
VSFNFNVMDASAAPGVTSTEPGGLESREMMRIAEMIGKKKSVTVIDVSELCPVFDVSGTAARLWPQLLKRAAKRSMRAYGAAT